MKNKRNKKLLDSVSTYMVVYVVAYVVAYMVNNRYSTLLLRMAVQK